MRFLVFLCLLCSTFSVAMLYTATPPTPQCAPFVPPAVPGPLAQPSTKAGILLINEVLPFSPVSQHIWDCSEIGTARPIHNVWVELYNPQSLAFDLYPTAKLDSGPGTSQSYLPFGAAIPAHGFLVIFPENGATFSTTEIFSLRLLFGDVVIDQVEFSPLPLPDQSYARIADGSPNWQITSTPTIDASNTPVSVTATPTHTLKHPSTKGSGSTRQRTTNKSVAGNISATTNKTSRRSAIATGTQPAWSNLQLPSGSTSSPKATTSVDPSSNNTTTTPPATNDTMDLPRKVLFTSLAIVFAGVLFLCWRRFKPT